MENEKEKERKRWRRKTKIGQEGPLWEAFPCRRQTGGIEECVRQLAENDLDAFCVSIRIVILVLFFYSLPPNSPSLLERLCTTRPILLLFGWLYIYVVYVYYMFQQSSLASSSTPNDETDVNKNVSDKTTVSAITIVYDRNESLALFPLVDWLLYLFRHLLVSFLFLDRMTAIAIRLSFYGPADGTST